MNRLQNGNGNIDISQLKTLVGLGFDLSYAYLSNAYLDSANLDSATGLNSDINIALTDINKDTYDGSTWTLTWTDGITYQCDPATGLFTQQ